MTVREHGWRRQPLLAVLRAGRSRVSTVLAQTWGCSWPNRLLDRAASHRRLAAALILTPAPMLAIGVMVARVPSAGGYAGAHIIVAVCSVWLAIDLVRLSAVTNGGRPHVSAIALLAGFVLLAASRPVGLGWAATGYGSPVMVWPALVCLLIWVWTSTLAERRSDLALLAAGRWAIAAGTVTVGALGLGQAGRVVTTVPVLGVATGTVATILLATGYFEARVLLRGLALLRVPRRGAGDSSTRPGRRGRRYRGVQW